MTTQTTEQAMEPGKDNHLADLWRSEFVEYLLALRKNLHANAKGCKEGGWYRGQLEQQIALYDCTLAAIEADRAKREGAAERAVAWMWKQWGWCVTAHGKHRQIVRYVDFSKPPVSTIESPDFVSIEPLFTSAQPLATVEPEQEKPIIPQQPPCTNDFVADGCEQFPEASNE